jgi:hypothetical protein
LPSLGLIPDAKTTALLTLQLHLKPPTFQFIACTLVCLSTPDKMRPDGPRPTVIGSDSGPEAPFPLRMKGKVVSGFGRGSKEVGLLSLRPRSLIAILVPFFMIWTRNI